MKYSIISFITHRIYLNALNMTLILLITSHIVNKWSVNPYLIVTKTTFFKIYKMFLLASICFKILYNFII